MADAQDSKSCEGNFMWVRLPPSRPKRRELKDVLFFCFNKLLESNGQRAEPVAR